MGSHMSMWSLKNCRKKWVRKTISKMWRDWKSSLSISILSYKGLSDAEDLIDGLKPNNMSAEDWKLFVDDQLSDAFKESREPYQAKAKSNPYVHTTGSQGFASVTEKLSEEYVTRGEPLEVTRTETWIKARLRKNKEDPSQEPVPVNDVVGVVIEKLQELPPSHNIFEDPLSIILGPEHGGRVHGMGLGTTPGSMALKVQGCSTWKKMPLITLSFA